jgi:hypothetical protein
MLNLKNLKDYIVNYINLNNKSIIYFGIGTYFYKNSKNEWNYEENQQFPPFLHDYKLKNIDMPILIILIDPSFLNNKPYIVESSNNFLDNSWTNSNKYNNLFESKLGINVISISDYVLWGNNCKEHNIEHNIEQILIELIEYISNPNINSLLFYHEFTGNNNSELEYILKNKTCNFDQNKICIDITKGSDNLLCYFNLSNPVNYPIILTQNFKLKYSNQITMSNIEKINILKKYKKFTIGFNSLYEENINNCIFSKNKVNYLIDKSEEMIICFQIVNFDLMIINLILEYLIPLIRQFYIFKNKKKFGTNMYGIICFNSFKLYLKELNIDHIINNFKLFDYINQNNFDDDNDNDDDDNNNFDNMKEILLNQLYNLLEEILQIILNKYCIPNNTIEEIIINLKIIENKYDLIKIYTHFIDNIKIFI